MYILEDGKMIEDQEKEKWYILIKHNIQDNGKKVNKMEKENSYFLMVIVMMEIGKMGKCMVMEYIKILVLKYKENGNMVI